MKQELLKGLTQEQIAKVKQCKNQDELLSLAKEEGIELTDEQLEAVSGGGCSFLDYKCPQCHRKNISTLRQEAAYGSDYRCNDCGYTWHYNDTGNFED